MARYIDAENPYIPPIFTENQKVVFLKGLALQPTADVVEVVRCKKCRYVSKCTDGYYTCRVDHRLAHDEDDYCSYGERSDT